MTSERIALVLGATGGIGGEVARRLATQGWTVRALHRHADAMAKDPRHNPGWTWIPGDALSSRDVAAAADGAAVIVHAVNPPGYRNWGQWVLPMIDNTIAAAQRHGARILLPGTVYNYGPDVFPDPDETAPQNPITRKGLIRVEMERRLENAATRGARVLIVRAGDYFGPRARSNWFSQGLIKVGRPVTAITNPGRRGIGHQWAYVPDVAETMVQLLERDATLESFARFHMLGHWDEDGLRMIETIRRVVGDPALPVRALPWSVIRLASPFVPLLRELTEMRYLWQTPLRLGNARLVATLGAEPHTPLEQAVRATLTGLGCREDDERPAGRGAIREAEDPSA